MTTRSVVCTLLATLVASACAGAAPVTVTPRASAPTSAVPSAPAPSTVSAPTVRPVATHPTGENSAWVIQKNAGKPLVQVIDEQGGSMFAPALDLAGAYQNNPDWSPDGEWLTFTNGEGGNDDLYVMRVDGSDLRKVYDCESPCMFLDDPAWSPDGRSIAAGKGSEDPNFPSILVSVDVGTGEESVLFEPGLGRFVAGPRWAPDGTQIVLEVGTFEGPVTGPEVTGVVLSVLDLSKRFPTALGLTKPDLFAATADWSRATGEIVYNARVKAGQEGDDLFTIPSEGGEPTRLTFEVDDGGSAMEPSWSSDGRSIVFVNANGALMRLTVNSGDVEPAFDTTVFANHPRARPAN